MLIVALTPFHAAVAAPLWDPAHGHTLTRIELPAGSARAVSEGCVLTPNSVRCWVGGPYSAPTTVLEGRFIDVTGSALGGCALPEQGELQCWGNQTRTRFTLPPGSYDRIAVGDDGRCGWSEDHLVCVGSRAHDGPGHFASMRAGLCIVDGNRYLTCGQKADGAQAADVREVDTGDRGACWLTDSEVRCASEFLPSFPVASGARRLSVGFAHVCVIERGAVRCEGRDRAGETLITGPAVDVQAGAFQTCVVRPGGVLECAGQGFLTGLPRTGVSSVSLGEEGGCAVLVGGSLACFGGRPSRLPAAPEGTFSQFSAGLVDGCALGPEGQPTCWGALDPPPDTPMTSMDASQDFACGSTTAGRAVCWGKRDLLLPTARYTQVTTLVTKVCGRSESGRVYCAGPDIAAGVQTLWRGPPITPLQQIDGGYNHACGLDEAGAAKCWGRGSHGETENHPGPFTSLSAGQAKTCAVRDGDGQLTCWGRSDALDALPVGPFVSVEVEEYNDVGRPAVVCGVRPDNTLACGWF